MTTRRFSVLLSSAALVVASTALAPPASAAVPANDNRADATRLDLPADVRGTLVDATLEPGEPLSGCADIDASVWYRFTGPKRGAVIIQLDAAGEMDADVELFKQTRSKLEFVDCEATNSKGVATLDSEGLEAGATYAIRVAREEASESAAFTLRVLVPSPPPEPPGKPLPTAGAKGSVDRLANPGDAYWTPMREGQTMRLSLRVKQCTDLEVYGPGSRSFDGSPVMTLSCGGYSLFTPTESGRHFLVVRAGRSRDTQRYRVRVAPARKDDTTPGVFIRNNAKVRGKVNGGIDFRDLYRFDVTRRSTLTLTVSGGPTMQLVRDGGGRMGRGEYIERSVPVGRYYVAVQGDGRYTLSRLSRTITKSTVTFNGRRDATIAPGASAQLALRVRPAVSGPAVLVVERFDPIDGWQFLRRYRLNVTNGSVTTAFQPPSLGRYRVTAEYKGSQVAASSYAGTARLRVQGPLQD